MTDLATKIAGWKVDGAFIFPDSVRIPCRHPLHGDRHNNATCPGYIASTDLAVWEQAIFKARPDAEIRKTNGWDKGHLIVELSPGQSSKYRMAKGDPLLALLTAVEQVLGKP